MLSACLFLIKSHSQLNGWGNALAGNQDLPLQRDTKWLNMTKINVNECHKTKKTYLVNGLQFYVNTYFFW